MFHPRSNPCIRSLWNKQCPQKVNTSEGIGGDLYKLKLKMANTLSSMTNGLRNWVSGKRIRYKEKGFNLDLAYICNNIIAMGYPADSIESIYRNRLEDVYKFLEENHHDHYKIYNLCLERNYDKNKFHGRVAIYPFEDHNPPTIELIQTFCEDVDFWLKADEANVAAVHCKAGKGRTGTMICCYLLYSGQQRTAENALACYDEKRTKDRKGVTIPSQRRYVQYFSNLIRTGISYERRSLQFCEIRFSEASLLQNQGIVHCSISVLQDTSCTIKVQQLQNLPIDFRKSLTLEMKNPPLIISGDVKVELTHKTPRKRIFHFWFNTFFVHDAAEIEVDGSETKLIYTLNKCEIDDAHKDKDHKCFSEDFRVHLVFYADSSLGRNVTEANSHEASESGCMIRNSYTLPHNNSSDNDLNEIRHHKSSSSASVSSLGGRDNSNCYIRRGQCTSDMESKEQSANRFSEFNTTCDNSLLVKRLPLSPSLHDFSDAYYDLEVDESNQLNAISHQQHFVNAYVSVVSNQKNVFTYDYPTSPHQQSEHLHPPSLSVVHKKRDDDSKGISNISCVHTNPQSYLNCHASSNSSKSSSISSHSSSSAVIGENEKEDWESAIIHNVLPASTAAASDMSPFICDTANYVLLPGVKEVYYSNNKHQSDSNIGLCVTKKCPHTNHYHQPPQHNPRMCLGELPTKYNAVAEPSSNNTNRNANINTTIFLRQ